MDIKGVLRSLKSLSNIYTYIYIYSNHYGTNFIRSMPNESIQKDAPVFIEMCQTRLGRPSRQHLLPRDYIVTRARPIGCQHTWWWVRASSLCEKSAHFVAVMYV